MACYQWRQQVPAYRSSTATAQCVEVYSYRVYELGASAYGPDVLQCIVNPSKAFEQLIEGHIVPMLHCLYLFHCRIVRVLCLHTLIVGQPDASVSTATLPKAENTEHQSRENTMPT